MIFMEREWYSNELSKEGAELYKQYLRQHDIYFEPSACYDLVHFECLMTQEEARLANVFLEKG